MQNSHCMQEILLKIKYFELGLSKSLKKATLFFLLNPFSFNGQSCQSYQIMKQVQQNSLIIYILSEATAS